jgi:hypothetical protein
LPTRVNISFSSRLKAMTFSSLQPANSVTAQK